MHNSRSYKKAQFFVVTAFVFSLLAFYLSHSILSLKFPSITELIEEDEIFVFRNVRKKSIELIESFSDKDCESLNFALEEFRYWVEEKLGKKMFFNYTYTSYCSESNGKVYANIWINLTLVSEDLRITSIYNISLPK